MSMMSCGLERVEFAFNTSVFKEVCLQIISDEETQARYRKTQQYILS